jgi:RNA polymerase sigma-70 factor, ECF subfamily
VVGKSGERERAPERPDATRAAFAAGRRAWPTISLPEAAFSAYLAARGADGQAIEHLADLYLACAVGRDDAAALVAFESTFLSRVGQFIGRLGPSPELVREVTQLLRIKLLVGLDGAGKLAQYAGRGTLDSWVCAAALRTAYDLLRERAAEAPGDARTFDVLAASDDVELQVLRARHHEEFRQALRAAMAGAAPRERTLLRLYFLEQIAAARIGQMYGVHETTALRWIGRARDGIVERMRAALRERLQLADHEFGELMALLRSRIDITVRDLLRTG